MGSLNRLESRTVSPVRPEEIRRKAAVKMLK